MSTKSTWTKNLFTRQWSKAAKGAEWLWRRSPLYSMRRRGWWFMSREDSKINISHQGKCWLDHDLQVSVMYQLPQLTLFFWFGSYQSIGDPMVSNLSKSNRALGFCTAAMPPRHANYSTIFVMTLQVDGGWYIVYQGIWIHGVISWNHAFSSSKYCRVTSGYKVYKICHGGRCAKLHKLVHTWKHKASFSHNFDMIFVLSSRCSEDNKSFFGFSRVQWLQQVFQWSTARFPPFLNLFVKYLSWMPKNSNGWFWTKGGTTWYNMVQPVLHTKKIGFSGGLDMFHGLSGMRSRRRKLSCHKGPTRQWYDGFTGSQGPRSHSTRSAEFENMCKSEDHNWKLGFA